MGLETERSRRKRLRFGFSGKRRSSNPAVETTKVTTDDILDSLTRQASAQVGGFSEDVQKGLEVLVDQEDFQPSLEASEILTTPFNVTTHRSLGRIAFVLMFLGGVLVVWLYGSGRRLLDLSSLNGLVQTSGVRNVFSNVPEVGMISLFALTLALWVAHRRKSSRFKISI